ncbi:MAG TPA: trehalose-6-phosphate synthase [Burkholderiaceae bacterium]|nr:trehalose-6-phosphate synthase [Burkholderiaceae bacterium]
MSRLIVVSNRVGDPRKAAAGGLAVALGDALSGTDSVWFGWSGQIAPSSGELRQRQIGRMLVATIDLDQADHDGYYLGHSNQALWPSFHSRLDLAAFESGFIEAYERVNRLFARKLAPLLRPDDVIWVHDYHLIPLAEELRRIGCTQRIGFFLHIPLPAPSLLTAIPGHEKLMRSLFAYDLVGLQSRSDAEHFALYAADELQARPLGQDRFIAFGRELRVRAYPIGIDVNAFRSLLAQRESQETMQMLRQQYSKRRLLVGVDRLDYSKGLPQRFRAFRELLANYPENRMSATLIQVASPTRESVLAYEDIRHELEGLAGEINGTYGELDWMPIRYMHRTFARKRLPGLYRMAKVALVTPLRDGMNLVAKEYVAVQDEADPGVLVLSRFAGAAEQLREALLVNPYDVPGTAQAIQRALHMPLAERLERHAALLERIRREDAARWRRNFLDDLRSARPATPSPADALSASV